VEGAMQGRTRWMSFEKKEGEGDFEPLGGCLDMAGFKGQPATRIRSTLF